MIAFKSDFATLIKKVKIEGVAWQWPVMQDDDDEDPLMEEGTAERYSEILYYLRYSVYLYKLLLHTL
jgi:hypothetical protein